MRPIPLEGVKYIITADPAIIHAADVHQFEVFSEFGYLGPGPIITEVANLPSIYYVAVLDGEVLGCVRIVTKSQLGFPTITSFILFPEWEQEARRIAEEEPCEEILFSTVRKGFRKAGNASVILNLYKLLYQDAIRRGIQYWFTAIDEKMYPYFTRVFNFKFEPIGEKKDYLGAPTIPTMLELCEGYEKLKRADPELGEFLIS
ncbi:MAG: hypothetical protein A2Y57_01965 [Candidatus Woykebacteria bacterium RBG_13_40_7b]|uniref:N-acyl amino acid synthase FeeM catalytic core domain-containing protein n=1 Tax=Candidatus Woykebacteria bacterium RBG_13_40_7b TaxID=1802594 RepID=A0A1G1WAA5_9BACT|nr:MAG: hypothetical protein A2Y57_01965 [Candidatus Woykebacteria bacterium RBG_13_40_7b]